MNLLRQGRKLVDSMIRRTVLWLRQFGLPAVLGYGLAEAILIACGLLSVSQTAAANSMEERNLTRAGMVGIWEGIDSQAPYFIYRMVVSDDGEADLICFGGSPYTESFSRFFGHASAIALKDGKVRIRFQMAPKHAKYFDWMEIEGIAFGEGRYGAIRGKIVKHVTMPGRTPASREWSEPLALEKGQWIRALEKRSDQAARILLNPKIEGGHAVSKEK